MKMFDRLNDLMRLKLNPLSTEATDPSRLASLYAACQNEALWLEQIIPFINDLSIITRASHNLQERIQKLTHAYIAWTQKPSLGSIDALQEPHIIIVLGTPFPNVQGRLDLARSLADKFQNVPIILSGGGRQVLLEADAMQEYLCHKGVDSKRLYKEIDSLDTKGNALFSKFLMREKKLDHCKNILLITSDFHGPRSLRCFEAVFGPKYEVAITLSPTSHDALEFEKLIHNEMKVLAYFNKEMFMTHRVSPLGDILSQSLDGDESSIFYQILTHDPLYHNRWDLARRYHQLVSIEKNL